MKYSVAAAILAAIISRSQGFLLVPSAPRAAESASRCALHQRTRQTTSTSSSSSTTTCIDHPSRRFAPLASSADDGDDPTSPKAKRMAEIFKEESSNAANMAASAQQMKDMSPEDMDRMIEEMDRMGPAQRAQLKAMGMDPDLMKKSMKMMRDNPKMMESARRMMEGMTPEQMIAQSRLAQEQMSSMTPEQVEQATKAMQELSPEQLDAAARIIKERGMPGGIGAGDPAVIEAMYRTAELMSSPPTGGVTLQAFATLPPISVLSGNREEDLSASELAECWADGSLGATRVDRAGFERVWNEVREYFEGDIMDEARKTAAKKQRRKAASSPPSAPASAARTTSAAQPVGSNLSPEQMRVVNEQVKGMSDEDMTSMLEAMSAMSPEQEARMKEMGVDPAMMKKVGEMMKSNPMARKAAQAMMKNLSPEQMLSMSQQAQQQMKNMSPDDYEKAMERMKKGQ